MQAYNCLVIEDEPLAAEILEDYIRQVPFLTLKGICPDAFYAMDVLKKEDIHLVFLDIHLPKLKGFEFLKSIANPPYVIISSAYHEYALEGYEYNIVDYLLKPVEFTRFLTAVNRFRDLASQRAQGIQPHHLNAVRPHLFVNINKKKVKIFMDEIIYVESLKEYIRIVTSGRTFLTKFPLGQAEEILGTRNFLRVHRSYIVAKDKIAAYNATEIEINNMQIPIGRNYREAVQAALKSPLD